MMILGLNTLGIVIEMSLGIWIFSKAFPMREQVGCGWKEVVNEAVLHGMILGLILLNFAKKWSSIWKSALIFAWISTLLCYRYSTMKRKKTGLYIETINSTLKIIELLGICVILSWNYWESYISIGMVWIANIFFPFFYFKYYRCKFYQAYIFEVLYQVSIQIMKCAYMAYVGASKQETLLVLNRYGGMHTYAAVIYPLLIYAIILILLKSFSVYEVIRKMLDEYKWWTIGAVVIENVMLNFFTDLIRWNNINVQKAKVIVVIAALMLVFILLFMIVLFRKSMLAEQKILEIRNETIEQQYQELRKAYEENRCLIHDEKHRMQYIDECLENGDIERARGFVKKSRGDIRKKRRHMCTGIPTLDFILNMKSEYMNEAAIDFRLNAGLDKIPIDETDCVVLLGNLMDNAIEAAAKCQSEKRSIELSLNHVNNMFLIFIKNTNSCIPTKKKDRFMTSKMEADKHGYGIESVKHIVQKYDGEIDITYDTTMFQVRISIMLD